MALFRYVTADHAATYRAIVQIFFEAKQHYMIELRPADVLERIGAAGYYADAADEEHLDYYLAKLVDWGNLLRTHDGASVARIEDFYRKRYVYHLTATGEAAHRAVLEVEATLGKSGSLQSTMLLKIRDALLELAGSVAGGMEPARLYRALHDIEAAFATLTEEANRYIGELNRQIAGERVDEERFVLHKRAVLAYISRFVEQLRRLAPEIAAGVAAVDAAGIESIIAVAATAADLPPGLGEIDPVTSWIQEQRERWTGIAGWFTAGGTGARPTIERLAEVAVGAVVGLTRTLGRLNDRRTRPVDRPADFRTLARWFSQCSTDDEAHALYQAAFGLYPARHFHLAEDDPDATSPSVSWWEAPPAEIPVRLRSRGSLSNAGRPAAAPDHSSSRQWMAQRRRQERAQVEAALRRFVGRSQLRMSDIASLDPAAFDLLLTLFDQVLTATIQADGRREARTSDGRLIVTLHSPLIGDRAWVTLSTPAGDLRCRNYAITVRDAFATEVRTAVPPEVIVEGETG